MVRLFSTCSLQRNCSNSGTTPSAPRLLPPPTRLLSSRRLGLIFVLAFCAMTGARPVVAGVAQPTIGKAVSQSFPDEAA